MGVFVIRPKHCNRGRKWIVYFVRSLPGKSQRCNYTDDKVIAFHDINPMAPVHLLIIRGSIYLRSMMSPTADDAGGHMVQVAKQLAKQQGIATKDIE